LHAAIVRFGDKHLTDCTLCIRLLAPATFVTIKTYAVGAAVALPPPHLPQYNCDSNMQLRKS